MKSIVKRTLLLVIMVIILLSGEIFAEEGFKAIEKSAEFEKWEKLSDEERKNIPQPSYMDLNISDSLKKSTYNSLVNSGTTEDNSKYIPTTGSYIVKDQQYTGLCWAFSFTSVLENTIAKKYNRSSLEYSPLYLDYNIESSFLKPIGDGANFRLCEATAVSGKGLTYESDMPFSSYYDERNNAEEDYYLSYAAFNPSGINSKVKINETTHFANIYKSYAQDGTVTYKDSSSLLNSKTYSEAEVAAIRSQIKRHIKENGAVSSYIYTSNFENQYKEGTTTCAFYSDSYMLKSDHAITIVGWDDTYSRTNFAEGNQPANDGAYIVLNSWGDKFGKNGYFYVSYDDAFIEQDIAGIDDLKEYSEEEKKYTNLYQHDELGMSFSFYFLNDKMTETVNVGYMANVFKREDVSKKEWVSEVGIYVPSTQGIEIYIDSADADLKNYGEAVASYTGANALEPGYHNIKLSSPVEIKGENFAVIAKCINENGAMYSLECNGKDSGITEKDNYYSKAVASSGESYMSNNGSKWIDVNNYQIPITSTQLTTFKNTNVCIKAFTIATDAPTNVQVTEVELDKESIELKKGNTEAIVATVKPDDATNQKVTWSTSDQAIATVNEGVVTGVSEGTATITVTTEDGNKTDSCEVKVIEEQVQTPVINVTNVKIDRQLPEGNELVVEKGSTHTLNALVEPSDATNKKVTWSSSDENIATVTGGVIQGVSEGTATITVITEDGNKTDSCEVKVIEEGIQKPTVNVTNVKIDRQLSEDLELIVKEGNTYILNAVVEPSDATNKKVTWSSSDENIATVTGGVIQGVSEGTATITVTTEDGNKTDSCEVKVIADEVQTPIINVTNVKIDLQLPEGITLIVREGATHTVNAVVEPSDATNKKVTWSSSDENIATVTGGVIQGVSEGTATITVTTEDGNKTDSINVVVKPSSTNIKVESIKLDKSTLKLEVGDETNLVVSFNPTNASNKSVEWSSSNDDVATISKTGIIKAISEGITTITVTSEDGNKTATCKLTVVKKTNTDDDIYKDNTDDENNSTNNKNDNKVDDTIAKDKLPNTGFKVVLAILGIGVMFVGAISFIRYRKLTDIK